MIQIQRNLHSLWLRFCFESVFALGRDPWNYTSPYQQIKYDQVLDLLPFTPIDRALELACAEGHFTVQLASHVGKLIAADISQIALARASKRCRLQKCDNVHFMHLDLTKNELPRGFKLIVCSEVLYYVGSRSNLQAVARKLADALEVNGYLITTNDNRVEDTDQASFDWFRPLGAKAIAQTLAHTPPLQLLKEIRTPFYSTYLFQRQEPANITSPNCPEVISLTEVESLVPEEGLLDGFSLAAIYNALVRIRWKCLRGKLPP